MKGRNRVYIATSLDGYIADKQGGIEWLESVDIPEGTDMGYAQFMEETDALVMGRKTFETVCGFDIDWPYTVPVYVLSNYLNEIPSKYSDKAVLVKGSLQEILSEIHASGHLDLYIDGGGTIQSFLAEDLIDEMIITTFPILLGGGSPLFSELQNKLHFELVDTQVFAGVLSQSHYKRKRDL